MKRRPGPLADLRQGPVAFIRSRLKNGLGREMGCPPIRPCAAHPTAESNYSKLRATGPARNPVDQIAVVKTAARNPVVACLTPFLITCSLFNHFSLRSDLLDALRLESSDADCY